MRTLVLNAGYEPLAIVSFKRALVLVMNDKATVIERVEEDPVWGTHGVYDRPAVIILARYVRVPTSRRVPVTRRGVLRRDNHRCGYCGKAASTIDHVLPRSRGERTPGRTSSPAASAATTSRAIAHRRRCAGSCASLRVLRTAPPGRCGGPNAAIHGGSPTWRSPPETSKRGHPSDGPSSTSCPRQDSNLRPAL